MVLLLMPSKAFAKKIQVTRLFGDDRYETAAEISKDSFEKADMVLIACGGNYPDALMAGSLATQIKVPILLVRKNSIDSTVEKEIKRLGAKEAIILGGEAAVGNSVESRLKGLGLKTRREAGEDRYDTASKIWDLRYEFRPKTGEYDAIGD